MSQIQENPLTTQDPKYTQRLKKLELRSWKTILNVQYVYKRNLQRINPGFTLDLGCGIGRNLKNLNGNGVGIDHNDHSINSCKERGFEAYSPEEFLKSKYSQDQSFDSILVSHVLEHMTYLEGIQLMKTYLPYLRPNGKIIIITPQEKGFASDKTHVQFINFETVQKITTDLKLKLLKQYSYPFPMWVGRIFAHNEFVSILIKP